MKTPHILTILTVILLYGCGPSGSSDSATTNTAPPKASADGYRQVSEQDGIRFFSRSDSVGVRGGALHAEGLTFGVIGRDGAEIRINLLSTTVDQGQIQTKDFGILKLEMNSSMQSKVFATDTQIKMLRTLQASKP
jgi:hypothetical protein